ncbi:MAG: class I SAM-dependent methyltransferase [Bacteroidales bacterium]|nr:class I SAM-dependent methyltransferase [Bacteroidales bacterium]
MCIVSEEFQAFVEDHKKEDSASLRLKYKAVPIFCGVDAITQIESLRKASGKLDSFTANPDFIFPSTLSAEQASNELVASYHASLFRPSDQVVDLTAGLGIDSMTIARKVASMTAIERFPLYADVLRHNSSLLRLANYKVINADSSEWITASDSHFDAIFIDPARRSSSNKRTYAFGDCEPDVVSLLPILQEKSDHILIKASPMLDVKQVLREIRDVSRVHVVSAGGECKELLLEIFPGRNAATELLCVALLKNGERSIMSFSVNDIGKQLSCFASFDAGHTPKYLYDPDANIMKVAPWMALTLKFPEITKIAPNTHLYVSDKLYSDFPGRTFSIRAVADKATIRDLKHTPLNIVCRNFPETADEVRKRLNVRSGQDDFLFCFRTQKKKTLRLLAQRL